MAGAVADGATVSDAFAFLESAEVIEQKVEKRSDADNRPETDNKAEMPSSGSEVDRCEKKTDCNTESQDSRLTDNDVCKSVEASQSQTGPGDQWRPSNPFLGVANSNSPSIGVSVTPKSGSSSPLMHTLTPVSDSVADSSPLSASAPSDMVTLGYSKMHESTHSSLCSASPYDSPTRVASGGAAADSTMDSTGVRPDSLYLSRSILQARLF